MVGFPSVFVVPGCCAMLTQIAIQPWSAMIKVMAQRPTDLRVISALWLEGKAAMTAASCVIGIKKYIHRYTLYAVYHLHTSLELKTPEYVICRTYTNQQINKPHNCRKVTGAMNKWKSVHKAPNWNKTNQACCTCIKIEHVQQYPVIFTILIPPSNTRRRQAINSPSPSCPSPSTSLWRWNSCNFYTPENKQLKTKVIEVWFKWWYIYVQNYANV